MKVSRTIAALVFLVVSILLLTVVACGGSDDVVGTWGGDGFTMEFKADGGLVFSIMGQEIEATYTAKDGKLAISGAEDMGIPAEIKYKVSGDTLTLISPEGEEETLRRAK